MEREDWKYTTPQYHLIRVMDYMSEGSEKVGEAFNSLIDALRYGVNEYDPNDILNNAMDSMTEIMNKTFSVMESLSAVFAESVVKKERKGEEDGEV